LDEHGASLQKEIARSTVTREAGEYATIELAANLHRVDTDNCPSFSVFLEHHLALACSEQCVIAADANVHTGGKSCTTLSNDDAASCNKFTAESFDTQPLGVAVAPVA
jgi:hypothetical protein